MSMLTLIVLTFYPCFVILAVALGISFLVRCLPEGWQRFLNFNLTDPTANRRRNSKNKR